MISKFERFKTIYAQGFKPYREIIVDTLTGVNYLFVRSGNSGGLTVLIDKDGKPVVTPEYIINENDLPEGKA